MAKFKYPLDNILRIKERVEEQKQAELGIAMGHLKKAKDVELAMQVTLKTCFEAFYENKGNKINASNLRVASEKVSYHEKALKAQLILVKREEMKVEKARLALKKALEERKIQETLKERAFEQYLEEEKQKEQQILDEIVGYRYATNREE